ncbi:hypothetical protein ABT190_36390 [Streptomyces cyaneofuscatus]
MGSDRVVSVEVDPALAQQAAKSNAAVGLSPRTVEGDGCQGRPEGAPYQRIIARTPSTRSPSPGSNRHHRAASSARGAAPSSRTCSRFSTCTSVAPRENSPATPPSCAPAPGGRSAAAGQCSPSRQTSGDTGCGAAASAADHPPSTARHTNNATPSSDASTA